MRIRGTANQIFDKYQGLARDAASSGDRVRAENYLQHAEHYFRLIKSMQPSPAPSPASELVDADGEQPTIDDEPAKSRAVANGSETEIDSGADQPEERAAKGAGAREQSTSEEGPSGGAASDDAAAQEEKKAKRRRPRRASKKETGEGEASSAPEEAVAS